jgi:oligopeptide transport system ATP-binding protein
LGIVGESGSGKTVSCLSIMGLIEPPGHVTAGEILFEDQDLLKLSDHQLEDLRGKEISMIFQDPLTSLNPVFTVEQQMTDVIKRHLRCNHRQAVERATEVLTQVGLPAPAERLRQYPFQLSGGLRQRVMIAMALSCHPKLIIADEPTTALDVSIQAQILDLLQDLKSQLRFALIFVSHDLGIIANLSDKVIIMYAGRCMEVAPTEKIFAGPVHPYTAGLLASAPSMSSSRNQPLRPIEGVLPDLTRLPPGCPFAPRCAYHTVECEQAMPPLESYGADHLAACYHPVDYGASQ